MTTFGQDITPRSSTSNTTVMTVIGGAGGSQPLETMADAADYLGLLNQKRSGDTTANVILQNNQQQIPYLEGGYEAARKKIDEIASDPNYQTQLNAAYEKYRYDNPPVIAGSYVERTPGIMVYNNELTSAKTEAEQALNTLKSANDINNFNSARAKYNEAQGKLQSILNKNPSSYQDTVVSKNKEISQEALNHYLDNQFSQNATTYQQNQAQSAWRQSMQGVKVTGNIPIPGDNATPIDYAKSITSLLGNIEARGGNVTQKQMDAYKTAWNSAGYDVIETPKTITSSTQMSSMSTPVNTGPSLRLLFPDVPVTMAEKSAIEQGITNSKLTPQKSDDLFWENENQKYQQNIMGFSSQWNSWANKQNTNTGVNPFSLIEDASLHNQQLSRNLTGKNLTQLPSTADYTNMLKNNNGYYFQPSDVMPNIPVNTNMDQLYSAVANEGTSRFLTQITPQSTKVSSGTPMNYMGGVVSSPGLDLTTPVVMGNKSSGGLSDLNSKVSGMLGIGTASGFEQEKPAPVVSKSPTTPLYFTPYGTSLPQNEMDTGLPYIPTELSKSESWITGLPVFGRNLISLFDMPKMIGLPGITDLQTAIAPTSRMANIPFFGNIAKDAAATLSTEYQYGTPTEQKVKDYTSNQPAWTRTFINPDTGVKSKTWTYNVGEPVVGETIPVGNPVLTINPLTGNKTYTQNYETTSSQNQETVTLSDTELVAPILASTKYAGNSNFQQGIQGFVDATYGKVLPENIITNPMNIGVNERMQPVPTDNTGIFVNRVYKNVRNNPFDLLGDYVTGAAIGKTIGITNTGVARAAQSELPVINKIGRAASTPIAGDIKTIAGWGLGGAIAVSSGAEIMAQPTKQGKIEKAADLTTMFAAFGKGMKDFTPATGPTNIYAGKQYFSGKTAMSPLETIGMSLRTKVRSYSVPKELRGGYSDVTAKTFRDIRYTEPAPGLTETSPAKPYTEPDISIAQTIGTERAPAVREAIAEQPHSIVGSVMVESQKSGLPTADVLRSSKDFVHDVDLHILDTAKLETDLKLRGETGEGIDIKSIEKGYPKLPGETGISRGSDIGYEAPSLMDIIIGEPIPIKQKFGLPTDTEMLIAGKDYVGIIGGEKMNVQFGRKAKAFQNDLSSPQKQYRLPKDFYDYYSQGKELIAVENVRNGKPYNTQNTASKALDAWKDKEYNFDFYAKEDIPAIGAKAGTQFTKKVKFGDIIDYYEVAIKDAKSGRLPKSEQAKIFEELPEQRYHSGLSRDIPSSIRSIISKMPPSISYVSSSGSSKQSTQPSLLSKISLPKSSSTGYKSSSSSSQSSISSRISPSKFIDSKISGSGITSKITSDISTIKSIVKTPISTRTSTPSPSKSSTPSYDTSVIPYSYILKSSSTTSKPSTVPSSIIRRFTGGIPIIPPGGSGGNSGRKGWVASSKKINPFQGVNVASGRSALNFENTFGKLTANVGTQSVRKGNLNPVSRIATLNIKQYNTKRQQNNNVGVNIAGLFNSNNKKRKKGRGVF